MKICNKCFIELGYTEFYPSKITKDGLMRYCKKCESARCLQKNLKKRKILYPEASEKIGVGEKHKKTLGKERQNAKAKGEIRYFTGISCINGHIAERLTINGACIPCSLESQARRRLQNIDATREKYRLNYKNNREKMIKKSADYRAKNSEKVKDSARKSKLKNRAKATALENIRRSRKKNSTPKWLTIEHKNMMLQYYIMAEKLRKICGKELAVDHIVPIKGKNVSGLNVPWNLRIIGKIENSKKCNKLDESAYLKQHNHILLSGEALPWNWK